MTEPHDAVDLTNLPRFLKHLGHQERDPVASKFAKQLLDEGGEVVVFWGPEQMDVWRLTIRRGEYLLTFGVERGRSGFVTVGPSTGEHQWQTHLNFAIFGWARAHSIVLVLDDPLYFEADVLAHGAVALDWLSAGNEDALLKISAAYDEGLLSLGPIFYSDQAAARAANQIRLMEEAAAAGTP